MIPGDSARSQPGLTRWEIFLQGRGGWARQPQKRHWPLGTTGVELAPGP